MEYPDHLPQISGTKVQACAVSRKAGIWTWVSYMPGECSKDQVIMFCRLVSLSFWLRHLPYERHLTVLSHILMKSFRFDELAFSNGKCFNEKYPISYWLVIYSVIWMFTDPCKSGWVTCHVGAQNSTWCQKYNNIVDARHRVHARV